MFTGMQVSRNSTVLLVALLLIFTSASVVRAESPQGAEPTQLDLLAPEIIPGPHNGPDLRLGTVTGYEVFASERVAALGGYVAGGVRLGSMTAEAEYSHLVLYERDNRPEHQGNMEIGTMDRAGIVGRLDMVGLGKHLAGPKSALDLWLEAGFGIQRGRWHTGQTFQRTDTVVGGGWLLDHRLKRPLGFPSRVGWHFGWRVVIPSDPRPAYSARIVCKAADCPRADSDPRLGLLVSSGMQFSW